MTPYCLGYRDAAAAFPHGVGACSKARVMRPPGMDQEDRREWLIGARDWLEDARAAGQPQRPAQHEPECRR